MPLSSAYGFGLQGALSDRVIFTSDHDESPDQLEVKEIFVSEATGKLVIVYDDGEVT